MNGFQRLIFPVYARVTGPRRKRKARATAKGRIVQTGIIVTAALGVDTDLTLIYQLFAFLLCLAIVARIGIRFRKPQVTVRRVLPGYATCGEPFQYTVRVINDGTKPEQDLVINDVPTTIHPTLEEFEDTKEPEEEKRNAYDRFIGFHHYLWLMRQKTGIYTKPAEVPVVPVMGSASAKIEATPLRRGRISFNYITVAHPDPLGITLGIKVIDQPQELTVLPKRYRISTDYEMPGGRHYQPGGVNSAWSIGESDEFVSLRDYRDGDSMRKIHWPSTAKRDKPVVREYQDEYYVRQALVLDTAGGDAELLEETVSVAASFTLRVDTNDSLLDLMFVNDRPFQCTAGRGLAHAEQLLEILATVGPSKQDFSQLSQSVLSHAPLLSGAILVLMDWEEDRQALVRKLRALDIALLIFVIVHELPEAASGDNLHYLVVGKVEEGLSLLSL